MLEPLRYPTGEEIQKGDRVLLDGSPGVVDFVAIDQDDPKQSWYVEEHGGGVMVIDSQIGAVFEAAEGIRNGDSALKLVERGNMEN